MGIKRIHSPSLTPMYLSRMDSDIRSKINV
jgi:hypothetical protein